MKKFFYIIKHNTNAESSLTAGSRQRYFEALEMIKVTFFSSSVIFCLNSRLIRNLKNSTL